MHLHTHKVLIFLDSSSITGLHYTTDYFGIQRQFTKVGRATVQSHRLKSIIIKPCNTLLIPITFATWNMFTTTTIEYIIMISKLKKPNQPLSTFNLADYPEIFL